MNVKTKSNRTFIPVLFLLSTLACQSGGASDSTQNNGTTGSNSVSNPQTADFATFSVGASTGVITGQNITVTVPYGTDLSALVATFKLSKTAVVKIGNTIQVSGTTSNDFTKPVEYTIYINDALVATYTITVKMDNPAITSYSLNGFAGTISAQSITVMLPFGTSLTDLIATFTTTGTGVYVGNAAQTSGSTSNDFTSSVTYVVKGVNSTSATYTVTAKVATVNVTAASPQNVEQGKSFSFTVTNYGSDDTLSFENSDSGDDDFITYVPTSCDLANGASCKIEGTTAFGGSLGYHSVKVTSLNDQRLLRTQVGFTVAANPVLFSPYGIALNSDGTIAYITNGGDGGYVSQCNIRGGALTDCQGMSGFSAFGAQNIYGIALNPADTFAFVAVYTGDSDRPSLGNEIFTCAINEGVLNSTCIDNGPSGESLVFNNPVGIAFTPDGNNAFVVNLGPFGANGKTVAQCSVNAGTLSDCTTTDFTSPNGVAVSPTGNTHYAAVINTNNTVDVCTIANDGTLADCASSDAYPGTGTSEVPAGIAFNPSGDHVFITSSGNNKVISCTFSGGELSGCKDSGAMRIYQPSGIVIHPTGSTAYIANQSNGVNAVTQCSVSGGDLSGCVTMEGN